MLKRSPLLLAVFLFVISQNSVGARQCRIDLFRETTGPIVQQDADLNQLIRASTEENEAPIAVKKGLRKLRLQLLDQIGPTVDRKTRETNVKKMESYLRMESFKTATRLSQTSRVLDYDAVIVGTGPHALFALAGLLKKQPEARVLVLSKEDTFGATFREGYVFNINSSNKPSGGDSQPLPGLGNINELPNLPIQVSDLTSVRYPEAADLGDALVANAYAVLRTYKNVSLLFDSQVSKDELDRLALSTSPNQDEIQFSFADPLNPSRQVVAEAQTSYVISPTGLGTPKSIDEFIKTATDKKKLRQVGSNGLPKVLTFEEFIRLMADTENPWQLLQDLNIKVVAPGDSGNVTMEFLLGLAAPSAYGSAAVQEKVLKQIGWIGQPLDTCKKFLDQIRNRYSAISSGYKTSDESVLPPLKAYTAKLEQIKAKKGRAEITLEDGSALDADLVILANGFDKVTRDVEDQLQGLSRKTSVSGKQKVLIAKTSPGGRFLVTGPSVRLPTKDELKGVIQNFVSLFNNAPRSAGAGEYVGSLIKITGEANSDRDAIQAQASSKNLRYVVAVEGLKNFKERDFAANPYFGRISNFNISEYIKDSFENVLENFDWSEFRNGEVKIKIKRISEGFEVFIDGVENAELIAALAYNRDFFTPLLSVMNDRVNTIELTTQISAGNVQVDSTKLAVTNEDRADLRKQTKRGSTFLSRLPPYIRALFGDQ